MNSRHTQVWEEVSLKHTHANACTHTHVPVLNIILHTPLGREVRLLVLKGQTKRTNKKPIEREQRNKYHMVTVMEYHRAGTQKKAGTLTLPLKSGTCTPNRADY